MKANIGRSAFSDRCRSTAPRPPLPLKNYGSRLAERARMPATWWATLEPIGCLSSPVSWRRRPTRWTNRRCVCRPPLSHLLQAANRHARVKLHRHVPVRCRSTSGNYLSRHRLQADRPPLAHGLACPAGRKRCATAGVTAIVVPAPDRGPRRGSSTSRRPVRIMVATRLKAAV
jgi:hypothetical protein